MRKQVYSFHLDPDMVDELDQLCLLTGTFQNRSEAVRKAIKQMIEELHKKYVEQIPNK